MNKQIVTLKNWDIGFNVFMNTALLFGDTYGHPRFEDGSSVRTSSIVGVTKEEECFTVETRNTVYTCKFEDVAEDSKYSLEKIWEILQDVCN